MARVQIIETASLYDGVHVLGASPDYPECEDEPETDHEYHQREWLHRHGLAIDDECAGLEIVRHVA